VASYICQSSGADIINRGTELFWARKPKGVNILAQGHDALLLECPEDLADKTEQILTETLETTHEIAGVSMKFAVEVDVGHSWAET
jgi:DNA polymerase I-like protein with 3'-5' exonuclease and polymerase domains